jgi:hypothetical protein
MKFKFETDLFATLYNGHKFLLSWRLQAGTLLFTTDYNMSFHINQVLKPFIKVSGSRNKLAFS